MIGEVLREIRPGMTEKSVAQIIGNKMLEGGCDGLKCQVGSGVRSGITNCTPTDKAIERGDVDPARDPRRHEAVSLQRHPHRRRRRADRRSSATSGT